MKRTWKWGFLGYGQVAQEHMMPAVLGNPDSELFAIASRSRYQDESMHTRHRFSSYEQVIDSPDVDIVYIALPNTMHATLTIRALQSGKHVLCEKPIAMTVKEIDAIAEASAQTGCKVMEGFMYHYSDRMHRLMEVLNSGLIGDITYIQSNFFSLKSRIRGIRADMSLGGGCLWDLGCYPVSLITFLRTVRDSSEPHIQVMGAFDQGVDTYLSGNLGFSDGLIGSFSAG
mgnify:CR=1 FL=1